MTIVMNAKNAEEHFKRVTAPLYTGELLKPHDIIEMGPELTAAEQEQARRVWETKNTQTQVRGTPYRPEPTVSMPSPEQVLIGDLLAIHPDLGLWAYDLARQGYEADYIKGRLNALVQEVEAERA